MNEDIRKTRRITTEAVTNYLDFLLASRNQGPSPEPPASAMQSAEPAVRTEPETPAAVAWPDVPAEPETAPNSPTSDKPDVPPVEDKPWHLAEQARLQTEAKSAGADAASAPRPIQSVSPKRKAKPHGSRQNVMVALIPVLAVALVVLIRRPLHGPSAASAATPVAQPAIVQIAAEPNVNWSLPPAYQPSGPDPMKVKPSVVQEANVPAENASTRPLTRPNLTVKGVLYSQDRPAAVVDTRVLHVGDEQGGATVVSIEKDGVEFEMNGQKWKQPVSDSD
jgi:hypothetical protein